MIKDIIKNSEFVKVNGNVIDLDYANGWSTKTREIYNELKQYTVLDSGNSINLGRCINEYTCIIDDGTERFLLAYKVDSGD